MSLKLLINAAPKLIPFFATILVYFTLFLPDTQPSVWAMCIKCAPILSLIAFVFIQKNHNENKIFSRDILLGLIFSIGGDALLIWPKCFLFGMVSFAVAQVFYIKAFGFRSINIPVAIPLYGLALYVLSILVRGASDEFLIGLPVYTFLLVTMLWRATARAIPVAREPWTWTRVCACLGGLCFVVSDAFIGFDKFHSPVPNAQMKIMTTYYLAQFGIALSVLNTSSEGSKTRRGKNNNYKKLPKTD